MAARSRAVTPGSSAGRVIAGSARGIRLVGPGEGTRPLGDRVKQALFAILEPTIRGRPFLDLYAGSGSAGIEALSRGAAAVVFVESDQAAIRAIERNLEATGLAGPSVVVSNQRVGGWLANHGGRAAADPGGATSPFAIVVVDPPYDAPDELGRALAGIAGAGRGTILAEDGVVVAKHFWKAPPFADPLLRSFREERFGETALTFYRWADDSPSHGEAS
jgi:16S rRNA (guanine966-N2)-methyltransferase